MERSDPSLGRLAQAATFRHAARGEVIFLQNAESDSFFVIVRGKVSVTTIAHSGAQRSVTLEAGESFGELALLDGEPRPGTAVALQATDLLVLHRDDVRRIISYAPEVALVLLKIISRRLRAATQLVRETAFLSVAERLTHRLHLLVESGAGHHVEPVRPTGVALHVSQQQLAAQVGATREAVTKELHALRLRGVLTTGHRRITVLRPDLLADQARSLPASA